MEPKKLKNRKNGWILKDGKPVIGELEFDDLEHSKLCGYGTPISLEMAKLIIHNYRTFVNDDKKVPHAFTFGKESLLAIISQPGCEGVRFYLAKKEFHKNIDGWKDGITLVAIGVKQETKDDANIGNDPEIGAEVGKRFIDDDLNNEIKKIMSLNSNSQTTTGLIYETIPPLPNPPGSNHP